LSPPHASTPNLLLALAAAAFFLALLFVAGCSASGHSIAAPAAPVPVSAPASSPSPSPSSNTLTLSPASATAEAWQTLAFALTGADNASCTWSSSGASVVSSLGAGQFQAQQTGSATVSVTCGAQTAQAAVTVIPQAASGPITIASGGTYSGIWNSNDPSTPAVTISTDEPVTLQDSVISGRGTLIRISGVTTGANVTLLNVTGTALDPGVTGAQRGAFVNASNIHALTVQNCTVTGASFGVYAANSTVASLRIANNLALNLEDRASDGQGGLLAARPILGHFAMLNKIVAPQGAEIGWNKIVQTMGQSSVEDVINIFRTQGAPGEPIWVHDNYIEGNSSPAAPSNYSGTGIIADGGSTEPVAAYAQIENNSVVHTAGSGVAIENGHDITAIGNRIVSCGQDASGTWFAMTYANAASIWDLYGTGPSLFYNNTVAGTAGGLVRPSANGNPMAADFWGSAASMTYPGDASSGNDFTNPCLANGQLNLAAEDAERAAWTANATAAGELIGDQHATAQ
jgi:hypothetical protein